MAEAFTDHKLFIRNFAIREKARAHQRAQMAANPIHVSTPTTIIHFNKMMK
jgi:hypothetical protein